MFRIEERERLIRSVVLERGERRFYAESGKRIAADSHPYDEELRRLVFLSPEERKRIPRGYPAAVDRLGREGMIG
ncbi:hypothetical protein [Actinorugispora endophytica]|uniref:hypothetical protein n=1 Tax=Actinorugispora endophytica TaxID=1605990 RepID=UPI00105C06AF|nr:hypothetical protein [Actinorugispora endophytica]